MFLGEDLHMFVHDFTALSTVVTKLLLWNFMDNSSPYVTKFNSRFLKIPRVAFLMRLKEHEVAKHLSKGFTFILETEVPFFLCLMFYKYYLDNSPKCSDVVLSTRCRNNNQLVPTQPILDIHYFLSTFSPFRALIKGIHCSLLRTYVINVCHQPFS